MTLAEDSVIAKYKEQGFRRVVVRRDEPNFSYPNHYHAYNLAFQVLEGSMEVTINHQQTAAQAGDYMLIPAGQLHSVHIGQQGCIYIHAEKEAGFSTSQENATI